MNPRLLPTAAHRCAANPIRYLLHGLTLGLVLLTAPRAEAQFTPGIIADRPSQLSPISTPGMLQLELGGTYEQDGMFEETMPSGTAHVWFPTMLVRYGLGEERELRLGMEYVGEMQMMAIGCHHDHGVRNISFGAKQRLLEQDGWVPELAVFANIRLPLGADRFSVQEFIPGAQVQLDYAVSDEMAITANVGSEHDFHSDCTLSTYTSTFAYLATERLGLFVDLFGQMATRLSPAHGFDVGATWNINEDFQADVFLGESFTETGPDLFIGTGASYRIP